MTDKWCAGLKRVGRNRLIPLRAPHHCPWLIAAGARFIATHAAVVGPTEDGVGPGWGGVAAMITAATGGAPYMIGNVNPLVMASALGYLHVSLGDTVMIRDHMDTNIAAGAVSGMEMIRVINGVTQQADVNRFRYGPSPIAPMVAARMRWVESDIPLAHIGSGELP